MEVLLRERRVRGTAVEYHDRELSGRAVTIGSAPDQTIQLLGTEVAPRHAVIRLATGALNLRCRRGRRIHINGKSVRSAHLTQGDRIELDGHELEIIAPPAGFDLGIQVIPNTDVPAAVFEAAFQTHVGQALPSKRSMSWLLLVVVLLTGLVIPLYHVLSRGESGGAVAAFGLDDRLWSTGDLLPAHRLMIGDDCSACHVQLFQRVQDEQCTTCHGSVRDHVAHPVQAAVGQDRCATCHREHNDPRFFTVQRDSMCTGCHARPDRFPTSVQLRAVTAFTSASHPEFDAHLLVPQTEPVGNVLSFHWEYRIESVTTAQEQSNLKFPHDIHLDGTRVQRRTDGAGLGCVDCHVMSTDREHFLPVSMDTHCRGCHDLKFDPSAPTRELPHGQPIEVIFALEGHFLRRFGNPEAAADGAPRRRLPDRTRSDEVCTGSAYECAMASTAAEVATQFTRRGCITCHVVEDNGAEDIFERFQVHPVRLQTDYYPASAFPHGRHLTQGDVAGDAACLTCHPASESSASQDLLIPGFDNCLGCHGDHAGRDRVSLNCVSCHLYHPRERMDPAAEHPM